MKFLARNILLIALFVFGSALCPAQDSSRTFKPPPPPVPAPEYIPNKWHTFSGVPGLNITMPGEPALTTRQIDSAFGQLTQSYYLLTTEIGIYAVIYMALPNPVTDPDVIKKMLDSGRDNMLAKNKGVKLLKEQAIKVAGYDGREWLIEDGDIVSRWRAFIDGRRLYQIALTVPARVAFKSGHASADFNDFTDFYQMIVSRFLDSASTAVGYGGGSAFNLNEALKGAVRGGVLNERAISLPKPSYPNNTEATGTVTVQVLVDEEGKVMWAKAVSGHPSLYELARKAALKARFEPVKSEGKPVKVTGILVYNFAR